jgi:hypothetical protein
MLLLLATVNEVVSFISLPVRNSRKGLVLSSQVYWKGHTALSTRLFNLSRSAASQERRDEEKRRKQRKDDVVVGKTSALRDATDYVLDPKATEGEWLQQASKIERKIFQLTEQGMASLRMVRSVCGATLQAQ